MLVCFGILLTNLGLSIKYNMIEAKEEDVNSMSINGWALGITFR